MEITLSLPHVFGPGSNPVDNAYALRALLDCLVALNLGFLKNHSVPALYRSGVVYGRTQVWETIPALYARGYGDCKSLTAALVAEYKYSGKEARPVFRFQDDAYDKFHILVQTKDGFEDPSKVLGMGSNENQQFHGRFNYRPNIKIGKRGILSRLLGR